MITDAEFGRIWSGAQRGLRSYALCLCRDRVLADDLVQQTALQAWEARCNLRSDSSVRPWLFVILRNYYYSLLRRGKYEVDDPEGVLLESIAVDPSHHVETELVDVRVALQELPKDQLRALSHVALEGLSYAETARLCACKEGTIKSRIARARQRLSRAVGVGALVRARAYRPVYSESI
jgi:RNA polymerase sigma-70 factor, ECF subfamily